jgi:hypothetical protein
MRLDISQLHFIDSRLRTMAIGVEMYFGVEFTATSLFRLGDSGVHGQLPLRGLDLRCHNETLGKAVAKYINSHWSYDESRLEKRCCIFHNAGQGWHLHLQVHPNTKRLS